MEIVEWISAIVVTLVIKISWTLRQTLETLNELHPTHRAPVEDTLYSTAYTDPVPHQLESNARMQQLPDDASCSERISPITSTPVFHTTTNVMQVTGNISSILEPNRDSPTPPAASSHRRPQMEWTSTVPVIRMPTELDGEIIRTTFARGKLSPETEMKYRNLLQLSVANRNSKAPLPRRHLRL